MLRLIIEDAIRRRRVLPAFSRTSVNRRRAHGAQLSADFGSELKMPVPFHRVDKDWNKRLQTLAADAIRRLPD